MECSKYYLTHDVDAVDGDFVTVTYTTRLFTHVFIVATLRYTVENTRLRTHHTHG